MKRQRSDNNDNLEYLEWSSLSTDVLSVAFGYCDLIDLWNLRRTNRTFRQTACLVISRSDSLNLSFFQRLYQGRKQQKKAMLYQEELVSDLLFGDDDVAPCCKRLELTGLRHVTGAAWLSSLLSNNDTSQLTSLDFTGCWQLSSRVLRNAITQSSFLPDRLVNLNLHGCRCIDAEAVMCIATRLVKLQHLLLCGCSQTINDTCFIAICTNLRELRALDMSGLNRITDVGAEALVAISPSMEILTLSSCQKMRLEPLSVLGSALIDWVEEASVHACAQAVKAGSMQDLKTFLVQNVGIEISEDDHAFLDETGGWKKLRVLRLDLGTPREGLYPGVLGVFCCFSFGSLREVDISGSEDVGDADIEILAATCAKSLTSLEMRACDSIGNDALAALVKHECHKLSFLDISGCYEVGDDGVLQLCPCDGMFFEPEGLTQIELTNRSTNGCPALRSLKMASCNRITDKTVLAIGGIIETLDYQYLESSNSGLKKLMLLDVRNCFDVTSGALGAMMAKCPSLIDVEARNTKNRDVRSSLLSNTTPSHSLRLVNGRRCIPHSAVSSSCNCTVTRQSQKLKASQGVPLQLMWHCVDCGLVESCHRGICRACTTACHKGHNMYVGSVTRFYCDCAYAVAGTECNALSHSLPAA